MTFGEFALVRLCDLDAEKIGEDFGQTELATVVTPAAEKRTVISADYSSFLDYGDNLNLTEDLMIDGFRVSNFNRIAPIPRCLTVPLAYSATEL